MTETILDFVEEELAPTEFRRCDRCGQSRMCKPYFYGRYWLCVGGPKCYRRRIAFRAEKEAQDAIAHARADRAADTRRRRAEQKRLEKA